MFCSWIQEKSSFGECFLANYNGQMMVEDFDNHLVVFWAWCHSLREMLI